MMKERRLCMSETNDEWMEKQRNKGMRKKSWRNVTIANSTC